MLETNYMPIINVGKKTFSFPVAIGLLDKR